MIPLAAPEAFGAGGGVDFLRSGHGASGFLLDTIGDGVAAYLARLHCCLLALLAVAGLQPSAFSRQLSDSQVLKHAYFRPWKRQWQPSRRFSIRSTPKPALAYISFYNARRLPDGVLASLFFADADDILYWADENLAIAGLVSARHSDYGVADQINGRILDDHLQLIITDHADITEVDRFQSAVRERWRRGLKLIPQEWI